MAIFGFGKEKNPGDGFLQTLAYLEDALRLRSPFVLEAPGRPEVAASLHSVSEDGRIFRLLPESPFKVDKGGAVTFTLIHDGLRIGGSTRAAETREGVVALQFPETLTLMERRRLPRARLNPKEGATLTALQDLFQGVGINSVVENISEGGARVRVEKAMTINTEKRLVLGTQLVPPGQVFMVLKLNKVPKCAPVLEAQGRAVYLTHEAGGLMMGFVFDKPAQAVEASLRRLVATRAKPMPDALPPKTRRPKEPEPPPEAAQQALPPPSARGASGQLSLLGSAPGPSGRVPAPEPSGSWPAEPIEPTEPAECERRVHFRLSLPAGFRAGFKAGDTEIADADLLDVSVGGCCLRLAPEGCRDLERGTMLDGFHFLHRDLPNGGLQARVSWILGKNAIDRPGPAEGRYCLVGLAFCDPPPEIVEGLEAYIAWHYGIMD
jgi:c-di-GMP-binding flagellar brake protein YcgR